jgi:hypothetical protein
MLQVSLWRCSTVEHRGHTADFGLAAHKFSGSQREKSIAAVRHAFKWEGPNIICFRCVLFTGTEG